MTGPKGSVVVRVQDKCEGCKYGDVDVSHSAFLQVADEAQGRLKVESQIVDCNSGASIGAPAPDLNVGAKTEEPVQAAVEAPASAPETVAPETVKETAPETAHAMMKIQHLSSLTFYCVDSPAIFKADPHRNKSN